VNLKSTYFNRIIACILFGTLFLPIKSLAQPDYDFRNPVLVSGTDKQQGAVYLFSNVKTGVDARVTITFISPGITLDEMDGASGYPEALQPTLIVNAFTSGYMEMEIEFLYAGTSTLFPQTEVPVTCIDVDGLANYDGLGNPINEFDEVNLSGGYVNYQLSGSDLFIEQSGNWYKGKNLAGIDYPGRDTTAKQAMYTVVNGNISSCTIRVGVNNQANIPDTRLRSVYFKKFTYPNMILARSTLLAFQGLEKKGLVALQWKIEKDNHLKVVMIEKGSTYSLFSPIAEISMIGGRSQQINYSFQDNESIQGNVFYRLKMISVTGEIKYSNVLMFQSGKLLKEFKIYPSVVNNAATLQITSATSTTGSFQLVDYTGRVVIQKNIMVQEGTNNIIVNNLGGVHPGHYMVLLKVNDKVYNQKIFKQ